MSEWTNICHIDEILTNMGRCALVNGEQIAIFRISDQLFAVNNHCPFSKANVLSRGLTGSIEQHTVVASPIYKQHFDLETGQCLEDENVAIKTYPVRLAGDVVQLAA